MQLSSATDRNSTDAQVPGSLLGIPNCLACHCPMQHTALRRLTHSSSMLDLPVLRPDLADRHEFKVFPDSFPVLWKELHNSVMEHDIIPAQQQLSGVRGVKIRATAMLGLLLSACNDPRIGAGLQPCQRGSQGQQGNR